jgi:hypothetical protein
MLVVSESYQHYKNVAFKLSSFFRIAYCSRQTEHQFKPAELKMREVHMNYLVSARIRCIDPVRELKPALKGGMTHIPI